MGTVSCSATRRRYCCVINYGGTSTSCIMLCLFHSLEQHGGKNVAFSVSVAARIREALGPSLAPENVSGSPALPIPRGFTCFYKGQLAVVGLHSQPGTGINSSNGKYSDNGSSRQPNHHKYQKYQFGFLVEML